MNNKDQIKLVITMFAAQVSHAGILKEEFIEEQKQLALKVLENLTEHGNGITDDTEYIKNGGKILSEEEQIEEAKRRC